MQALRILLLSDGRPGHYHLAEGIIAALARRRSVDTRRVEVRRRSLMPGRSLAAMARAALPPPALLRVGYRLADTSLPQADLVVSAGGETIVANAVAARALGICNVFCGTLRHMPPEAFSLIVSSYARHTSLPRHIVALKPNGIDPDQLGRGPSPRRIGPGTPPALAGLLIGGNSGLFRYTTEEWRRLAAFVGESHAAHGTRWLVSTSRRSPAEIGDALAAMAGRGDGPIAEFIDFRRAGPGTLPRIFAQADAILCTEDSSTMVSEAVCARLPVVGVSPRHHGYKDEEREYRDFMRTEGWCRFMALAELTPDRFLAALSETRPLAGNHLDLLANALAERLPQLF